MEEQEAEKAVNAKQTPIYNKNRVRRSHKTDLSGLGFAHISTSMRKRLQELDYQTFRMEVFSHDYYMLGLPSEQELLACESQEREKVSNFFTTFLRYGGITDYTGKQITVAPVVRLFGYNQMGQKCCLHCHGYWPYFYIKGARIAHLIAANEEKFMKTFLHTLEDVFNQLYRKKQKYSRDIASVLLRYELVQKTDFYGYHAHPELFIKLYVYDPKFMKPLAKILQSGILMGISFQPYEVHLGYFMHFYADCNLFGLQAVEVYNYRYRKNFDPRIMKLFEKFYVERAASGQGAFSNPLDICRVQREHPELFSCIEKTSACYIEADLHYENMLNFFLGDCDNSEESVEHIQRISQTDKRIKLPSNNQVDFKVQITKALNNFWEDERTRRELLGVQAPLQLRLDYSPNIEASLAYKLGFQDNLHTDHSQKYWQLLQQHVAQYFDCAREAANPKSKEKKALTECVVDRLLLAQYHNRNYQLKIGAKSAQTARWNQYAKRKRGLLAQLYENAYGENNEEADDLAEDEDQLSQQELEDIEALLQEVNGVRNQSDQMQNSKKNAFEVLRNAQRLKMNSDAYWRNRYQVSKGYRSGTMHLKGSVFEVCEICDRTAAQCACRAFNKFASIKEEENELCRQQTLTFKRHAPKVLEVLEDLQDNNLLHLNQYAYYDNSKDFFEHYKEEVQDKSVIKSEYWAQVYARDFVRPPQRKDYAVSLKLERQLPLYWRVYLTSEYECDTNYDDQEEQVYGGGGGRGNRFQFVQAPPSYSEIVGDVESSQEGVKGINLAEQAENAQQRFSSITPLKTGTKMKKESDLNNEELDAVSDQIADITILLFEVFAKSTQKKLSNYDTDAIECLFFAVDNEKARYLDKEGKLQKVMGVIIADPVNYDNFERENSSKRREEDEEEVTKENTDILNLKFFYQVPEYVNDIIVVRDEVSLIKMFIHIVFRIDPDIICGYDIEIWSLNYFAERSWRHEIDVMELLSRAPRDLECIFEYATFTDYLSNNDAQSMFSQSNLQNRFMMKVRQQNQGKDEQQHPNSTSRNEQENDSNATAAGEKIATVGEVIQDREKAQAARTVPNKYLLQRQFSIGGRMIFSIFRSARQEIRLTSYDIEAVVYQLFGVREPVYDSWLLTKWYNRGGRFRGRVLDYFARRVHYAYCILDRIGTIGKAIECSRLYGCDFQSSVTILKWALIG